MGLFVQGLALEVYLGTDLMSLAIHMLNKTWLGKPSVHSEGFRITRIRFLSHNFAEKEVLSGVPVKQGHWYQ